jgi:hypothetical protein
MPVTGLTEAPSSPSCDERRDCKEMSMKRVYVATRLDGSERQRQLARDLKWLGWQLTYDWTKAELASKTDLATISRGLSPRRAAEIARAERDGVVSADLVVVLLDGGAGTHVELGMALALGKRVVVVGEQLTNGYSCVFYELAERVIDVSSLLAVLTAEAQAEAERVVAETCCCLSAGAGIIVRDDIAVCDVCGGRVIL